MNQVQLIGHIVRDLETKYTGEGLAIASFTVAVNRPTKDNEADFIPVKVFGKQAESCEKYLAKGSHVAVEGTIHTDSYTNKDGKKVYVTEVVSSRVEFLTPKSDSAKPVVNNELPEGFAQIDDSEFPDF